MYLRHQETVRNHFRIEIRPKSKRFSNQKEKTCGKISEKYLKIRWPSAKEKER